MPAIISVGMATGDRLVTNTDVDVCLGKKIGFTNRVMNGVGIEQRFWVKEGQATSDLCVGALRQAIDSAGIVSADITSLLVATSSPDMQAVSTAAVIQKKLALSNRILASNNSDACPGFIFGLHRAFTGLTSPLGEKGYYGVIGGEVMSPVIGKDDEFSHEKRRRESIAILVGDAAGAVIAKMVTPDKEAPTNMGFAFGADGEYADELGVEAGGSKLPINLTVVQEGRLIFIWTERQYLSRP